MQLSLKYLLSVLLTLAVFQLQAQVQFAISVPAKEIGRKDELQVEYLISGGDDVSNFQPPQFKDWILQAGPIINTSYSIVNGKQMTFSKYIYILLPSKQGKLGLPSTSVEVDGKSISCAVVWVNVKKQDHVDGVTKPANNVQFQADESLQGSAREDILKPGEDPVKKIRNKLFAKVVTSKTRVFVGEPFLVEYKLYTRLKSDTRIKQSEFSGCSVYEMTTEPKGEREIINGKDFTRYVFRKVQLVALQPGLLTIPPATLDNNVSFVTSTSDYRSRFYDEPAGVVQPFTIKTEPVSIEVLPLPKEAADYPVGKFQISAQLKKDSSAVNESNSLIIAISGTGNFKAVNEPEVNWPSGFYHFDAIETSNIDKLSFPLTGKRVFEIPFEASNTGKVVIPGFDFSFFNAETNKIEKLRAADLFLTVTPAVKKNLQSSVVAADNSAFNIKALYFIIPVIFLAGGFLLFRNSRKKPAMTMYIETLRQQPASPMQPDLAEKYNNLLLIQGDAEFYTKAGAFTKELINSGKGDHESLVQLLKDCNTMLYTPLPVTSKKEVLEKLQQAMA